jgi:hypothetical protein
MISGAAPVIAFTAASASGRKALSTSTTFACP